MLYEVIYNCVSMASKQSLKLFDIKNKIISTYVRFAHFVRYSILMRQKEMLVIGNSSDPVISELVAKMSGKFKITIIEEGKRSVDPALKGSVSHLSLEEDNYPHIEQQLAGANLNSIIVSPHLLNEST